MCWSVHGVSYLLSACWAPKFRVLSMNNHSVSNLIISAPTLHFSFLFMSTFYFFGHERPWPSADTFPGAVTLGFLFSIFMSHCCLLANTTFLYKF